MAKLGDRLTRKLEQVDVELIKFGQGVETAWSMPYQYKTPNLPIYEGKRVQEPQLRNPPAKRGGGEGGVLPCLLTFVTFNFGQQSDFKGNPNQQIPPGASPRNWDLPKEERALFSNF